jgi:hypothetical protein
LFVKQSLFYLQACPLAGREIRLGFLLEISMRINRDKVFRSEWGELYVDIYDLDDVFLYAQRIDEQLYHSTGAVAPADWQEQQTNDYRWRKE